jgi:hypothetical protein
MASMTTATTADMAARNPSSRKDKRELLKGVQRRVTTDPNDLVQSDDEEVPPNLERNPGQNKQDTYQNPPSQPSSIKVSKSSNSQVTSSVPGLRSLLDMSMTEILEENQILNMVKGCIKQHVFSIWKFYQKDFHDSVSEDPKTMCGFVVKHTNIRGTEKRWLKMRRIVVKTHTDLCNNAIKNLANKIHR